jgi:hypothetical protein
MAEKTPEALTTKQVAEALGTTPRELRAYLRAASRRVGSGKRYAFTTKDVPALKTGFDKWSKERAEAKAAEAAKPTNPRPARTRSRRSPRPRRHPHDPNAQDCPRVDPHRRRRRGPPAGAGFRQRNL